MADAVAVHVKEGMAKVETIAEAKDGDEDADGSGSEQKEASKEPL